MLHELPNLASCWKIVSAVQRGRFVVWYHELNSPSVVTFKGDLIQSSVETHQTECPLICGISHSVRLLVFVK
jgi:hypothetical protein